MRACREESASLARQSLSARPGVDILATSREARRGPRRTREPFVSLTAHRRRSARRPPSCDVRQHVERKASSQDSRPDGRARDFRRDGLTTIDSRLATKVHWRIRRACALRHGGHHSLGGRRAGAPPGAVSDTNGSRVRLGTPSASRLVARMSTPGARLRIAAARLAVPQRHARNVEQQSRCLSLIAAIKPRSGSFGADLQAEHRRNRARYQTGVAERC